MVKASLIFAAFNKIIISHGKLKSCPIESPQIFVSKSLFNESFLINNLVFDQQPNIGDEDYRHSLIIGKLTTAFYDSGNTIISIRYCA